MTSFPVHTVHNAPSLIALCDALNNAFDYLEQANVPTISHLGIRYSQFPTFAAQSPIDGFNPFSFDEQNILVWNHNRDGKWVVIPASDYCV